MRGEVKFIFSALLWLFIIPILFVWIGFYIDGFLRLPSIGWPLLHRLLIALPLLAPGLYLSTVSNYYLWRVGGGYAWGDVSPEAETRRLVTVGPYRYMRNPMILGYTLVMSAVGLIGGSPSATVLLPLLSLVGECVWIKVVEEPRLEERFGEAYREYRRRVPFLIPLPGRRWED